METRDITVDRYELVEIRYGLMLSIKDLEDSLRKAKDAKNAELISCLSSHLDYVKYVSSKLTGLFS